jgi:hypothetical protein
MAKKDRKAVDSKALAVARRAVPITWNVEGVNSIHANNMIVQADEHDFYLSFFEAVPPIIMGDTPEELLKHADGIKGVEARCVARLVINSERIGVFLNAIQSAISKRNAIHQLKKPDGINGKDG